MTRLCAAIFGLALVAGCETHRHSDTPYVRLVLRKMTTAAKVVAIENGTFPIGTSKQLPSPNATADLGKGCCGSKSNGTRVDNKCPVSKEFASDPIWAVLEVAVDEPSFFRYTYESKDGKSFVITAEGDLDCDGNPGVYTVSGSFDAEGHPTTTLVMPHHVY